MKKHELNETQKKAYTDLFVNRDDTYVIQKNDGCSRKNSPLTDDILFNPNENVGAYQLNKNNTVKYAVLDIDLIKDVWSMPDFDIRNWLPKNGKFSPSRISLLLMKTENLSLAIMSNHRCRFIRNQAVGAIL